MVASVIGDPVACDFKPDMLIVSRSLDRSLCIWNPHLQWDPVFQQEGHSFYNVWTAWVTLVAPVRCVCSNCSDEGSSLSWLPGFVDRPCDLIPISATLSSTDVPLSPSRLLGTAPGMGLPLCPLTS